MPKSYGQCRTGGSMEQQPIPFPVDPSLRGASPQQPPRPTRKPAPARVTPTTRAAIVRERIEGDSATTLATRYGISRQQVNAICREVAR